MLHRSVMLRVTTACFVLICSVCAPSLRAQAPRHAVSAGWGVSIPVGDNYIDEASAANFALEWGYRLLPTLSAGVSAGYGSVSESDTGTLSFDGSTVTGAYKKSFYAIPLLARLDWFPLGRANTLLQPYVGVGAGARYARFEITGDAIVTSVRTGWAESFSARAGLRVRPCQTGRFFVDARCAWDFGGNDWPQAGVESGQQLSILAAAGILF